MKKYDSLKWIVSIISIGLFLYFFIKNFDLYQVLKIISNVNLKLFIIALFIYYFSFLIKAARWKVLLEGIGVRLKFSYISYSIFMCFFFNSLAPMRFGDFYRMYLLKKNKKIPISKTLGTIFIEKFADAILLVVAFVILALAVFHKNLPNLIFYGAVIGIVLITGFLSVILLTVIFHDSKTRYLPQRLIMLIANFKNALNECTDGKILAKVIFFTITDWLFAVVFFYMITLSLNLSLPFPLIAFILTAENLLTAIPITPAGVGFVESGVSGILILFGIGKNLSLSVAILDRLVTYWLQIVFGLLVYLFVKLNLRNKKFRPQKFLRAQ